MPNASDHHLPATRESLRDDLKRLGLSASDFVVVHSSLSGLGWVDGGANTVIDALLDTVDETGTVLFPTLTGTELDGPDNPPVMHVTSTACWTGIIPETARQRQEARRSLHPTHSVAAIGAEAEAMIAGHETGVSPCDAASPWGRLSDVNGRILLLGGVTQQSNTTLHALEERAEVPYHLQAEWTDGLVTDTDGTEQVVHNRLHQWGWERHFGKIDGMLQEEGVMRCGSVGTSTACLIEAHKLRDVLLPVLRRDPLFLLSDNARQRLEQE